MDEGMAELRRTAAAMSYQCDRLMARGDRYWRHGLTDKLLKQYTGLGVGRYNRAQLEWRVRALGDFANAVAALNGREFSQPVEENRAFEAATAVFRAGFPVKTPPSGKGGVS